MVKFMIYFYTCLSKYAIIYLKICLSIWNDITGFFLVLLHVERWLTLLSQCTQKQFLCKHLCNYRKLIIHPVHISIQT